MIFYIFDEKQNNNERKIKEQLNYNQPNKADIKITIMENYNRIFFK